MRERGVSSGMSVYIVLLGAWGKLTSREKSFSHAPRSIIGIRCGRVVSVEDFETGCPGFDPQSRQFGHGGVPLGKAHFLA